MNTLWLIYYKQREKSLPNWIEANTLTRRHPAEFLAHCLRCSPHCSTIVMWAIEVPEEIGQNLEPT